MSRLVGAVDAANSSSTPLGALEEFVGEFTNVSSYGSVSVTCQSDVGSVFSGLKLEWSTTGTSADLASQDFTFDPVVISQDGFSVHATVRASYVRVRYQNSVVAQSFFVLETRARRGSMSGTIRSMDPKNTFITNLDVQTVQAVMSGVGRFNSEQLLLVAVDDTDQLDDSCYLFTTPRPVRPDGFYVRELPATLTPVVLTLAGAVERPLTLSVTNNVLRGNLYLKFNTDSGLSPTSFDYKVPAQHTWQLPPQAGTGWGGQVFGVWDEVYVHSVPIQAGNARVVSTFYG